MSRDDAKAGGGAIPSTADATAPVMADVAPRRSNRWTGCCSALARRTVQSMMNGGGDGPVAYNCKIGPFNFAKVDEIPASVGRSAHAALQVAEVPTF